MTRRQIANLVCLIIAAVLIFFAAVGVGDKGVGSLHVQTGWAGVFFLVLAFLIGG